MEKDKCQNYQNSNVKDVDMNGYLEWKTPSGALNAEVLTGTKKEGIQIPLVEIKGSKELKKGYRGKFQLIACPQCGKPHWVSVHTLNDQRTKGLCRSCVSKRISKSNVNRLITIENKNLTSKRMSGKNNPAWKGGRFKTTGGYIELYLHSEDFFYPMGNKHHRVMEHRLIMAKYLGRCLHAWEIVHHKNHIKDDNRIDNLQLVTDDRHKQISIMEQRVEQLEKENTMLKTYISSLGDSISLNSPTLIKID